MVIFTEDNIEGGCEGNLMANAANQYKPTFAT